MEVKLRIDEVLKSQYLKILFFMLLSIPGIVFSQDDSLPIEKRELFFGNSRIALQMVKVPGESYFVGRYYEGEYTVFLTSEIPDYTTFKRNGKGVTFYDNEFKFVMEQGTYKNDLLDGFGTYYKNQGNKIYEGNWKEGKRNGFGKQFYPDGKLRSEGEFKNNLSNGKGRVYNQNGHLYFEGEYRNGEIYGKGKIFYESGKVYSDMEYKDGILNGNGKIFYESGEVNSDIEYKNGLANGNGKVFNIDGTSNFEGTFVDGKRVVNSSINQIVTETKKDDYRGNSFTRSKELIETTSIEGKKQSSGYSQLELFGKFLMSDSKGNNIKSNSNGSNKSYTNSQSNLSNNKSCPYCTNTGKCKTCSKSFSKPYYVNNGRYQWRNDTKLGYILCNDCSGRGHKQKSTNGGYSPSEDCHVSVCVDGWIPCRDCNSNGNSKTSGNCKWCNGTGYRK